MTYLPVETPGGTVWVEIDQKESDTMDLMLVGIPENTIKTFSETAKALKANAEFLIEIFKELAPDELEVSFGINAAFEAGAPLFGLAKASAEASYSVKMKWKNEEKSKS